MDNKLSFNKSPVIISGMHRSGTGLLSEILESHKVFLGKYKQENNESLFFLNLNRWLMSLIDTSWDNPADLTKMGKMQFNKIIDKLNHKINSRLIYLYFGKKAILCKKSFYNFTF